jgi:hypothetical protein
MLSLSFGAWAVRCSLLAARCCVLGAAVCGFAAGASAQNLVLGSLQDWLAQPTMTGDWGGLRTQLEDKGINWQTWLTAEPVRNFNGYKGVTTAWADTLAWGADVDLGKFYDVDPDGTFRAWMTKRDGRNPGADKIGSLFQTQETYGQGRDFRLNEISFAQALWNNVINIKGGFLLGRSNFWLSFTLLVIAGGAMYAPYGPFFAWIAERLPRNVAGGAIALINGFGALGSFVGSYAIGWLDAATGTPAVSYLLMAGALLISGVITLAVGGEHDPVPDAATALSPHP